MKRKNLLLIAVFAIVVAAVIVWPKGGKTGAGGLPGGAGAPSGAAGAPGAASSTVYRITSVEAVIEDLHSYLEVNGDVEAENTVAVFPDTGGKLARVNSHLGSRVSKGDVIAEIDPSKPGVNYSLSPVYAPISGTITSMPVSVGSTVSTGTTVASIGDIGNLQVTAKIPEREIAVLKTGLSAEVTFEAYPGVVFNATVFRVSPLVDPTSRTKEIFLSFDKDDERFNAGMFAKIKLYTTVSRNAVVVPEEAVTETYEKFYAYIVNGDGTVTKKEVTRGVSVDGMCQILSGLEGGERIAYEGVTVLSDGVAVKDISQKDADAGNASPAAAAPDGGKQ